ncbi:MAG TPA: hypothetical protein VLA89_03260 [Gemmatimonadales bacterium]|nr:hypothetical protein [Gemmatimonadales bacterium]
MRISRETVIILAACFVFLLALLWQNKLVMDDLRVELDKVADTFCGKRPPR